MPAGAGLSLDRPYRPVRIVFRLLATGALRADTGDGLRALPLAPLDGAGRFSGDAELRASGWRRGQRRTALAGRPGRPGRLHDSFGHLRDHGEHVMGALNSLATLGLNLALSQRAQANESKELRQERDRQIQAIRLRDAEDGRQQEQALRRRLAEERARAGGAGVGSSGGSADAILAGLVQESRPRRIRRAAARSDLRIDDIRQQLRRPPQAQPARLRRPLGVAGQPVRRLVAVGPEPARLSGWRRQSRGRPARRPSRRRPTAAAGRWPACPSATS